MYGDLVSDPIGCLKGVYDVAGLEFDDAVAAGIRRWLDDPENDPKRFGTWTYDPADFGLTNDDIRSQFPEYCDLFGFGR